MNLIGAIPVAVVVCLTFQGATPASAQKVTHPATRPAPVRAQRPDRPQKPDGAAAKPEPAASPENLEKLLKLSPDQRTKALSSLPPARRTQIEAKLANYEKMPLRQRANVLDRYRKMQSLSPQKQQQVRASLRQFAALPQPRKGMVQKQLNQFRNLPDADRRTLMNSEEFRNKFTPAEQQMVEDISSVAPGEV